MTYYANTVLKWHLIEIMIYHLKVNEASIRPCLQQHPFLFMNNNVVGAKMQAGKENIILVQISVTF